MKVLLIDKFIPNLVQTIQNMDIISHVGYYPYIKRYEILNCINEYDILILNSKTNIDKELIDRALNMKLIIRAGVGMDHFDLEYLKEKGIKAYNTAGANADAVAEHTIGMLLALRHNIAKADQEVKQFLWLREENRGSEIKGKTVGIIGFGNTGKAFARRLIGFECKRILVYDKYKSVSEISEFRGIVEESDWESILESVDILSLHIPLTTETYQVINLPLLSKFKKNITLLNLSRGNILNLDHLLIALDEKIIKGVALDVLPIEDFSLLREKDKVIYENLFSRNNVILSPHIGGWSAESLVNIDQEIAQIIKREL